jgi:ankyrin repeat protein
VLHVAALRHHYDTAQALVDGGFPLAARNARRWTALDDAISMRDRRMVRLLYAAELAAIKAHHKAKRGALLQTMREMPDYSFKVWPHMSSRVVR